MMSQIKAVVFRRKIKGLLSSIYQTLQKTYRFCWLSSRGAASLVIRLHCITVTHKNNFGKYCCVIINMFLRHSFSQQALIAQNS